MQVLAKVLSLPQWLFRANLHSEIEAAQRVVQEIASAGAFPPVPVAVVSGGTPPPKWLLPPAALRARRAHQEALARLSPQGEHVVAARSGHFPHLSEPQLVLEVLRRLAKRVDNPASAR